MKGRKIAGLLAAVVLLAAAQVRAEDWPTVAHDMQRTNYTPVCPAPPYKYRWVWSSGSKVDISQVPDPRHFNQILPDLITARFLMHQQPMVRGDAAYIGSVEGDVYAIDLKTGETRWKSKAGGGILHCVTVGEKAVYAATLRGVDAFALADGKKLWTFEEPRYRGFWACPALVDGTVLVGSLSGFFYGLDAETGKPKWEPVRTDGPIYCTPAADNHAVYFGSEDMCAYAVEIATGKLLWKSERMVGVSFGHYWPVVAAKEKAVIFRTAAMESCHPSMKAVEGAGLDYQKAQEALRKLQLEQNPAQRSFFVFDTGTGQEKVKVAAGHFGFHQDIAPPPIVRDDGAVFAWHFSQAGVFQGGKAFQSYASPVDFARLNFQTGFFEKIPGLTKAGYPSIVRFDDFHQNSMGGEYLFGAQYGLGTGCTSLKTGKYFDIDASMGRRKELAVVYGKIGAIGNRNEHGAVAPTILKDVVLFNGHCGFDIIAYETK